MEVSNFHSNQLFQSDAYENKETDENHLLVSTIPLSDTGGTSVPPTYNPLTRFKSYDYLASGSKNPSRPRIFL